MRRKFFLFAVITVVVAGSGLRRADAWGADGHVWINLVAASKLPLSMPEFMRTPAATERLGYLGPEPDRWRNRAAPSLKDAQEPDHYIDMEHIPANLGELPIGRYEFIQRLYQARTAALALGTPQAKADELLPEKIGFQPYITMEVYERLKATLREYRKLKAAGQSTKDVEENAIFYAGWLGHYVADGSQPLHTSVHYDGWTGQNPNGYITAHGIHSEFESRFVSENVTLKDFAPLVKAPLQLQHPFQDYWHYLKTSQSLVEPLYKLEKAGGFKDQGSTEGREFVRQRLAAGAQMLANMWYTAWMESEVEAAEKAAQPAASSASTTAK